MLFAETDPNDIFNSTLRSKALEAQSKGLGVSIWHGTDIFTQEDAEVMVLLEHRRGFLAVGKEVIPCVVGEQGHHLLLAPDDPSKGRILVDIDKEYLSMNLERTGCHGHFSGSVCELKLWDRVTGETIWETRDADMRNLIHKQYLNPNDLHHSGFNYARKMALI